MPQWCEDWLQVVLASFERDTTSIEGADRVCLVLDAKHMESVAAGIVFPASRGCCGCASIATASLALFHCHSWTWYAKQLCDLREPFRKDRVVTMVFTDVSRYCHSWILRSTCMYGHTWQKQCALWKIYWLFSTILHLCGDVHVMLCMFMPAANLENHMWWPVTAACLDTFGHVWASLFSSELLPGGTTDMFV